MSVRECECECEGVSVRESECKGVWSVSVRE